MKYIKQYEHQNKPQVGDYVIMRSDSFSDEVVNFINNNIGKISELNNGAVIVRYKKVPKELKIAFELSHFFNPQREFHQSQIVEFAPTLKELKHKLLQNKYNI
jgi:hypothetical protein